MAFSEHKVAQMAAYLLGRAGGRMSHMKLMKLLYLADRESLDRFDEPISGDAVFAMNYGPVLSETLNLINGERQSERDGWEEWISDRANHEVALREPARAEDRRALRALSDDDIDILADVWERFQHMTQFQLADWTHDHCGEWEHPQGSSCRISYRSIFVALGRDAIAAREAADELRSHDAAARLLAKY